MNAKTYKDQLQIVDGSGVGEANITTKLAYNVKNAVEYISESKVGTTDRQSNHYIQKCIYDASDNLIRIVVALNRTNCNITQINLTIIGTNKVKIESVTGDFIEVNIKDSLMLNTGTQIIQGEITQKISDTEVLVSLNNENPLLINEIGTVIALGNLIVALEHPSTKDFDKRRWDRRVQYIYGTLSTE
jgi:hypothetical protein